LYKIPANTLFSGKNVFFVPECHSTNSLALEFAQNADTPEGSVVITHNQTAGRGQRGNSWVTEPGKNLTLSIILKPGFLPVMDQFQLNIMTSLAVHDLLHTKGARQISIKWPNDILASGKKICGILIENQLQGATISSSVVGIGLNINQENFTNPSATSLKIIRNATWELQPMFENLMEFLEGRYLQLRNRASAMHEEYLNHLYWRGEVRTFVSGNVEFEGTITGINPLGKLEVSTNSGLRTFDIKEITYIR
jgi:BirA family transcriptional regulator, biotin operon repressor / biotin---[acetyl-CoA-carboxylase] ligase